MRRTRQRQRRLRRTARKTRKRYWKGGGALCLGLLAIFKNEAMVIREWVDHYRKQGYDHIVMLNNESTDDYMTPLKGTESYVHVIPALGRHKQNEHYTQLGLPKLKELGVNVLSILDLDEYLFVKDGRPLRTYIEQFFSKRLQGQAGPSGFSVPWTMFGSSGHVNQPASVRRGFTWKRQNLSSGPDKKTTVWLEDVKPDGLHQHASEVIGEVIDSPPELQLNHYAIMSKQYFNEVKQKRGDVLNPKSNSVRDETYYQKYNYKDLEDTVLKEYVEKGMA